MKKLIGMVLIIVSFLNLALCKTYSLTLDDNEYKNNIKRDLLVLMVAYEDEIEDIEVSQDSFVYLILKNGKKVLYDDKKEKGKEEKISNADIQDTLEIIYPLNSIDSVLDNIDPARGRSYSFLNVIYGSNRNEIEKNLSNFSTGCGNIMFNKNAKAGESLKKSLNGAKELISRDGYVSSYVFPINGTYNYRVIQDTGRLSPHAYGIAIDLNRNNADYWKWVDKAKGSKRIEGYPKELVKIFEDNGFVWGGKWSHFDILHFEYRPEIILKSKYFGDLSKLNEGKWYEGVPIDEKIERIIKIIDCKII
ncbi:M15 family metallopeptidase [Clostridium sp. MB05]